MAILRSDFPKTIHWRAADLRAELSRLHTVLARTYPERSRKMQNLINTKADDISTLTGTGPTPIGAKLSSGVLVEATVVTALAAISDGSLDITVDGTLKQLRNLNFTAVTSLATIAAVIDAALTGADCTSDADQIFITSTVTGYTSRITETVDPAVGTYVGDDLKLETALGATVADGKYSAAHAGLQVDLYPEFRDFNRAYKIAVDFAQAHLSTSVVLTAIAGQIQHMLKKFDWVYA